MGVDPPNPAIVPPTIPQGRWPRDVIWARLIVVLFVAHIGLILLQACPYWTICFPCTPVAPILWPIVAMGLAAWLIRQAICDEGFRSSRSARVLLAVMLIAFGADTLTGGDYRWFEIAMRHEMRKCGGPALLQNWVQGELDSPSTVAAFEDHGVNQTDLPPEIQAFAADASEGHIPQYRRLSDGGPWFMFDRGGLDMGWGIIVGRSDLIDPSPVNMPYGQHRGWTKRLYPGVYLYAF